MSRVVQVKAQDMENAVILGKKMLEMELGKEIDREDLKVKLVNENKGFFGFGSKKKEFEVSLIDEKGLTEREEDFLAMASETINIDGDFEIKITDEGIFLRVFPPEGDGDPAHYQQVKQAIEKRGIVEVDWQAVQEIVHAGAEEWEIIAPRKPELDRDGEAQIEISGDKLEAYLSYSPSQGGKKLISNDLYRILDDSGVKYGIIEETLNTVIRNRETVEKVLVASGDSPKPGKDVEFTYYFEENTDSIGTRREDGTIDYYDLGLITNVEPGDVLVTRKPPEEGEPGKAVTGQEIPPPRPSDKDLPGGKNVEKKDENTLVATIAGQVVKDGSKVNVLPVYEVNGNVDLSVGNIDFLGNVIIKGDVLEGFKIKASGHVEIRGHLDAAEVEATGDVIIHKGFIGKNKGWIKTNGDVKIKFVENGTINTEQNIIVTDAVMHSKLTAGENIMIKKKKGLLVGGIAKARNKIEANIIGSTLATTTQLEVGVNPEMKRKINELEEEIRQGQQNITKTKKAISILEKLKEQHGKLPQDKELMYHRLKRTSKKLSESIETKTVELGKISEKMDRVENCRIVVNQKIYPGVKLTVGRYQYSVRDELSRTSFVESEGEVRQVPL